MNVSSFMSSPKYHRSPQRCHISVLSMESGRKLANWPSKIVLLRTDVFVLVFMAVRPRSQVTGVHLGDSDAPCPFLFPSAPRHPPPPMKSSSRPVFRRTFPFSTQRSDKGRSKD